jgi:hypothetical protein
LLDNRSTATITSSLSVKEQCQEAHCKQGYSSGLLFFLLPHSIRAAFIPGQSLTLRVFLSSFGQEKHLCTAPTTRISVGAVSRKAAAYGSAAYRLQTMHSHLARWSLVDLSCVIGDFGAGLCCHNCLAPYWTLSAVSKLCPQTSGAETSVFPSTSLLFFHVPEILSALGTFF